MRSRSGSLTPEGALRALDGRLGGLDTGSTPPRACCSEVAGGAGRGSRARRPGRSSRRSGSCWPGRGSRAPATRRGLRQGGDGRRHRDQRAGRRSAATGWTGWPTRSSRRWGSSGGSTRWRRPSSTTRSSPPTVTASCTSRLTGDDLPRFRRQFKTYLNQNTIRDIAGFQSQLNKQAELIRQRIATINTSLVGVDYNPAATSGWNRCRPRTPTSVTSAPTCGPAPTTRCPARTPTTTPSRSSCR